MNIYHEWNFRDNPFKTTSLPAEDEGEQLIAGREQEIRRLTRRLFNQPQIPTIEGLNGVGKTSLINVSIFRAFKNYLKHKDRSPLFIPCIKTFQIREGVDPDDFLDEVLIEIAQTLIRYQDNLRTLKVFLPDNLNEIDKWLNSPFSKSVQGSIGTPLLQVGGGRTFETNTSRGFEKSGFRRAVQNWLLRMFPTPNSGGLVCVIDNMELLEESRAARKVVEALRDTLFTVHGIRWVLCGSLGIISSIVSSPRLEGLMHDPIQVGGILKVYLNEVFQKRVEAYKENEDYYLPLTRQSFEVLYDILKWNIRNTLKYANDYCTWVDDEGIKPMMKDEKEAAFMDWITAKSSQYFQSVKAQISPRALRLFKDAVALEGVFALSDHELFDFDGVENMKTCIEDLAAVGLVVSLIDSDDHRRKSIQITPKGWFVSHAMGK